MAHDHAERPREDRHRLGLQDQRLQDGPCQTHVDTSDPTGDEQALFVDRQRQAIAAADLKGPRRLALQALHQGDEERGGPIADLAGDQGAHLSLRRLSRQPAVRPRAQRRQKDHLPPRERRGPDGLTLAQPVPVIGHQRLHLRVIISIDIDRCPWRQRRRGARCVIARSSVKLTEPTDGAPP
ncbi:MAG: hypothetical protein AB1760_17885 [Pseudomonadota bacterium]